MTSTITTMNELVLSHGLNGTYPDNWDQFRGQEQAKRQLQVAAQSARMRGAAMSHVLLASGEAGIGKTTLGLLTAAELGANVKLVTGKMGANEARIALSGMEAGDVLLIDELHQLVSRGKANAEWLLHLLADGVLLGPMGPEIQPPITVIACTTDLGKLPDTIISRFPLRPVLEPYTEHEAMLVAISMAQHIMLHPLPFPQAADFQAIARAGSCNPRTMGAILSNLRDIVLVDDSVANTEADDGEHVYDLTEALAWLGLSLDGLTKAQRTYLAVLYSEFAGQAGERPLSDRLGEPGGLRHIEQPLLRRGLIARTRQGRVLTKDGIRRAREEIE